MGGLSAVKTAPLPDNPSETVDLYVPKGAFFPVHLTSVAHPEVEIAEAVTGLLADRLHGSKEAPCTIIIPR